MVCVYLLGMRMRIKECEWIMCLFAKMKDEMRIKVVDPI